MPEIPETGPITFRPPHYAEELRQAVLEERAICAYRGHIIVLSKEHRPRILRKGNDYFEDITFQEEQTDV